MNIFVDTSVWSLALRRDHPAGIPEVARLRQALAGGDVIFTTGLILQELLQGFDGPKARDRIVGEFAAIPAIVPDIHDHIAAAELRNRCRRRGAQIGTIDALLALLAIRHELPLLTTDRDFDAVARHANLSILKP